MTYGNFYGYGDLWGTGLLRTALGRVGGNLGREGMVLPVSSRDFTVCAPQY